MISRFSSLILVFLLSTPVLAAVTLLSVQTNGISNLEGKLTGLANASTNTIYGGLGGSCTANNGATCNSCATATAEGTACNSRRIYDDLYFYVEIKTDKAGNIMVTDNTDNNPNKLNYIVSGGLYNSTSPYFTQANTTITVGIPWGQVCNIIFGSLVSPYCEKVVDATKTIRVGVDSGENGAAGDNEFTAGEYANDLQISILQGSTARGALCANQGAATAEGVCNFIAYPGDDKVFIEEVMANCNFGSNYSAVRIYYSQVPAGDTGSAHPDITSQYKDLKIASTTGVCTNVKQITLSENTISGLANDNFYRFSAAVLDKANNVSLIMIPSYDVAAPTVPDARPLNDNSKCYNTTNNFNCHYAVPEKVIGLMDDDLDCFITTAAYGSPFKPKVKTFRKFRDIYLKTNSLGRLIISTYYKYSPPMASWIHKNPWSQKYVRMALYPLWAFASLSLHHPLSLLVLLFSFVFLFRKKVLSGVKR